MAAYDELNTQERQLLFEIMTWNGFRALHRAKRLHGRIRDNAALLGHKTYFEKLDHPQLNKYVGITGWSQIGFVGALIGLFAADGGGKVFFGLMLLGCIIANVAVAVPANELRKQILLDGAANDFRMCQRLLQNNWLAFNAVDIPRAPGGEFNACEAHGHIHHNSESFCPLCQLLRQPK